MVAPILVELIPVAVVLKLPEVNKILFAPKLADDAPSPDKVSAPEVPVRFSAPVVKVSPLLAVRSPAEVTVPVPEVEIFPEVVTASPAVLGESVVPVLLQ